MKGKRILILSASVGAGHLRAAQALELALQEIAPEARIRNADVLQFTNSTFRRLYGRTYLDIAVKAPHVLGYFYDLLDRPRPPKSRSDRLRVLVEKLNMKPFLRLLAEKPWDTIIATHFLPAEILSSLREAGKIGIPYMTVTTDYQTHRLWISDHCSRYCTATEEGAVYLQHLGVKPEIISATGIPIHPLFCVKPDRDKCLHDLHLKGTRPVVVQMAGGFGIGPVESIYSSILEIETPLEVVTVAGRNEALKSRLDKIPVPSRHRARVLGFTDKMHEIMSVADVVVSKPGGLTTSEAFACGAAIAVINPVPGQESRNSDYILENGAGIKIDNVAILPYKLGALLSDGTRLARLKKNALALGRPRAAYDVARLALGL
jgi:processive 1,2-diacylglycerol beta-glucosyltransferase